MTNDLVNSEKVTILAGDPVRDFWLEGTVNRYPEYRFHAKVYDVGSVHGIEQGRISKLQVRLRDRVVMNYERGWDQVPISRRDRQVLEEILAGFPERGRQQIDRARPTAPERPRGFFMLGKARRSQRNRDDDDYER
jgi:hypothetical protein